MRKRQAVHDEDGVVAVLVALLLVVLLGMLALGLDWGLIYVRHRAVRAANDAAALAAAQSCGLNEGASAADAQAAAFAEANAPGAVLYGPGIVYDAGCVPEGGTVTVHYQGDQDLYIAPAVGVDSPQTLQAQATAMWGGAGGATNVAPLMLSMGRLSNCDIPNGAQDGDRCFFWWDNGTGNDTTELSNAEWGLMDLTMWGVAPGASCPGNVNQSDVTTWIREGFPGILELTQPPPTFVCRGAGFQGGALDQDVNFMAGQKLIFPINDSSQQVQADGSPCRPGGVDGPCTVHKYAIVAFGVMEVVQVWTGEQAVTQCAPANPPSNNGSIRCLEAMWRGVVPGGLFPCEACPNLGLLAVTLTG